MEDPLMNIRRHRLGAQLRQDRLKIPQMRTHAFARIAQDEQTTKLASSMHTWKAMQRPCPCDSIHQTRHIGTR